MSDSANLFVYLLSGSKKLQYGSWNIFKIADVCNGSCDFSDVRLEKEDDIVCVATAFDADLDDSAASAVIDSFRACPKFKTTSILLNDQMHTVGNRQTIVHMMQPVMPAPVPIFTSDDLIYWLRLQIQMKDHRDRTKCEEVPKAFFDKVGENDRWKKYPELVQLACKLQSLKVCWHLSQYFESGLVLNSTRSVVLNFFDQLLHGYHSLKELKLISDDTDTFLISAIEAAGKHRTVNRSVINHVFGPYFRQFEHLKLVVGDDSYILKATAQSSWYSSSNKECIVWNNNWSVRLNGTERVAEKVVRRSLCIPCLSCLQAGGEWSRTDSIKDKEVSVHFATEEMYKETCVSPIKAQSKILPSDNRPQKGAVTLVGNDDYMKIELCFRSKLRPNNGNASFAALKTIDFETLILKFLNDYKNADAAHYAAHFPVVFEKLDRVVVKDSKDCELEDLELETVLRPLSGQSQFSINDSASQNIVTASRRDSPEYTYAANVHGAHEKLDRAVVEDAASAASHHHPASVSARLPAGGYLFRNSRLPSHLRLCGLRNPGVLCPFNSLLQAWFHIKAFRNVVLSSESDDQTLNELKFVFRSLQNTRSNCIAEVISFVIVVWFLFTTYILFFRTLLRCLHVFVL